MILRIAHQHGGFAGSTASFCRWISSLVARPSSCTLLLLVLCSAVQLGQRKPGSRNLCEVARAVKHMIADLLLYEVDHRRGLRSACANDKQRGRLITTSAWQKQRNRPG